MFDAHTPFRVTQLYQWRDLGTLLLSGYLPAVAERTINQPLFKCTVFISVDSLFIITLLLIIIIIVIIFFVTNVILIINKIIFKIVYVIKNCSRQVGDVSYVGGPAPSP